MRGVPATVGVSSPRVRFRRPMVLAATSVSALLVSACGNTGKRQQRQ